MPSFRGFIKCSSGTGQGNTAYCFSRDGAGKFSLGSAPKVQLDTAQGYIEINAGITSYLQFAIDTAATNFGQSNFGTLASTGGEQIVSGCLEITEDTGNVKFFTIKSGFAFYNGTDKLFFAIVANPPISP